MTSCPTIRDLEPGAVVLDRQKQISLQAEEEESQKRTLKDEWNLERMRVERGMVVRILAPKDALS